MRFKLEVSKHKIWWPARGDREGRTVVTVSDFQVLKLGGAPIQQESGLPKGMLFSTTARVYFAPLWKSLSLSLSCCHRLNQRQLFSAGCLPFPTKSYCSLLKRFNMQSLQHISFMYIFSLQHQGRWWVRAKPGKPRAVHVQVVLKIVIET